MGTSIQVSELNLLSEDEEPIFRNLNFSVPEKVISNIVLNKNKRDSLLDILIGEKKPDRGQVLVAGRNVVRSSPENIKEMRRKDLGFIPGNFNLPFRTVLGTLRFKMKSLGEPFDTKNKIEDVLDLVGLTGKENHEKEDLNSLEKAKLTVAIAAVNRPRIIISNGLLQELKEDFRNEIFTVLEKLREKNDLTVLLATERSLEGNDIERINLSRSSGSDTV